MFKDSKVFINPKCPLLCDAGYQGIAKIHPNSKTPIKKKKNKKLTNEEKAYNKEISKDRIYIEHINRRCKIFRITKETYRGKHKNYGKTWNLAAAIVNLRYAA